MKYFLAVLGMVFIIEGLPYLTFPENIKKYLLMVHSTPNRVLRVLGFIAVLAGLALVWAGTQ